MAHAFGSFLTSSKHIYTPWGRALAVALGTMKSPSLDIQEALLTAFELIRFEVLTDKPYSKTYSSIPGNGKIHLTIDVKETKLSTEKQQKHIRLLSRALSLLPMEHKNVSWTGPLDRDLLVFNSFVKALDRSYRNLCEMLTLSLFLNNLAKKERNDYFDIANSLPYLSDSNVSLGLVTKHYLSQTQNALAVTETAFSACSSLKSDLSKGFQFWDGVFNGVKVLREAGSISEATYMMFSEANDWLKTKQQ
ncbi:hypothetical protein EC973_007357 [Apophysomyces ossiformis]|uniref:Post-transcriptional regulator MKT1 C-terminal domain-containing protein n=1 Tax=Apophysomyces ossiformis TaxID=679940 RepID=A0A8H7BXX3_9FUNG|nr:hypothetical protein EC973_007357 [Apophysomyces ossiformis]